MTELRRIQKFDVGSLKSWGVIFLIGHMNAGKTTMVKEILNTVGFGGEVVTNEIDFKKYARLDPVERLYTSYTPGIVKGFVEMQRWPNAKPRYLVLDHCLFDSRWMTDQNIHALFKEAEQLRTLLIITMTYPMGVASRLLPGIDYICIFRENYAASRKKLYDMYCKSLPTIEQFNGVMNMVSQEEYSCLVFDRSRHEERIYWYKTTKSRSRLEHWLNTEVIQHKNATTAEANTQTE